AGLRSRLDAQEGIDGDLQTAVEIQGRSTAAGPASRSLERRVERTAQYITNDQLSSSIRRRHEVVSPQPQASDRFDCLIDRHQKGRIHPAQRPHAAHLETVCPDVLRSYRASSGARSAGSTDD